MVTTAERIASANALHNAITRAVRRKRAADYDLSMLLRRCVDDGLYRDLGYTSIAEYGERAHGLGRAKTRALVRLAMAMEDVPRLADAVRDGVVPWTKAREVARVATNDTVVEWLTHAQSTTNRELEQLARHAFAGDNVTKAQERQQEADPLRSFVIKNLSADQYNMVWGLIERIRQNADVRREDFSAAEALVVIAQRVLADFDSDNPTAALTGARYQRVIYVCTECGQPSGETGQPHDTDVLMADCDCAEVNLLPEVARVPRAQPAHTCDHHPAASTRGTLKRAIPPRIRRAVLHRDRHTCRVPHCTNRLWLDLHHITPRSEGGAHTEDNLICLCSTHHHLHHDGGLGIEHVGDGRVMFRLAQDQTDVQVLADGPATS